MAGDLPTVSPEPTKSRRLLGEELLADFEQTETEVPASAMQERLRLDKLCVSATMQTLYRRLSRTGYDADDGTKVLISPSKAFEIASVVENLLGPKYVDFPTAPIAHTFRKMNFKTIDEYAWYCTCNWISKDFDKGKRTYQTHKYPPVVVRSDDLSLEQFTLICLNHLPSITNDQVGELSDRIGGIENKAIVELALRSIKYREYDNRITFDEYLESVCEFLQWYRDNRPDLLK